MAAQGGQGTQLQDSGALVHEQASTRSGAGLPLATNFFFVRHKWRDSGGARTRSEEGGLCLMPFSQFL